MSEDMITLGEASTVKAIVLSENSFINSIKDFFIAIAELVMFNFRFFKEVFIPKYEVRETLKQCYLLGYRSFPLIAITGFIMGLVMTIQSRPTLAEFGAESWLPAMVAVSMIREIGPVITALIFAGKVGSGIGAELASMKVTEQIDAMEVSGINPFKYLIVTRMAAATIMLPLLAIVADGISLYGAYVGVNLKANVNVHLFFLQVFGTLTFSDVFPAIIKTFFFGYAVGLIGCFQGYYAKNGTEGVGAASNASVVFGSLLIFIIDMIAVQITSLFS